jgi:hypothetical protein
MRHLALSPARSSSPRARARAPAREPDWWTAAAAPIGLGPRAAPLPSPKSIACQAIQPALTTSPQARTARPTGSGHERQPGHDRRKARSCACSLSCVWGTLINHMAF